MSLRIYLVRHAPAATRDNEQWPDDDERPLTREGTRYFKKVITGLGAALTAPGTVLSSPSLRAWQTADLLTEIGWPSPEVLAALLPGGEASEVLASLPNEGRVALVGHAPDLGRIASLLLTRDPDLVSIEMKKGSVTVLDLDQEGARATLKSVTQPSLLRRIG